MIRKEAMGQWEFLASDEVECISPAVRAVMEDYLNSRWLPVAMRHYRRDYLPNFAMRTWGVPSLLVRLDMPPGTDGFRGVYEVEANTAGLGVVESLGVPVCAQIAKALQGLGIHLVQHGVLPSREAQREDHNQLLAGLSAAGISTMAFTDPELPLWLRAGEEDAPSFAPHVHQCVLLHRDGGGHKRYLCEIGSARMLDGFSDAAAVFSAFPEGLTLKPWRGWGSRNVDVWTGRKPWKDKGSTRTRVERLLTEIFAAGRAGEYLVQEFLPPQYRDGTCRIWRAVAVWDGTRYRVIGGNWSERPSLRNHGASDTVNGPLLCE